MRREWEEVTLGEIADLQTGPFGSQLKAEEYVQNGIPVVMPINIDLSGTISINKIAHTAEEKASLLKKYKLKNGDIVFSRRGDLSKIGYITNDQSGWLCGTGCLRARPKENIVSCFLHLYLKQKNVANWLEDNSIGQTMKNINTDILSKLPIILPSYEEQKKIAEALSLWDSVIEKTEKLIALEEKKLSAFAIKLFLGKSIFQTKNICLTDLLKEKSDLSTGLEEVFSVSVHKGLVNQIEHLGRSFAAANTDNYNLVKYGYLVYTKSPTGDFPYGIVKQSSIKKDVIVSPLYGIYEPVSNEIGLIVEFFFESPIRCKNYLYPLIQKGAKNTISISNQDFLKGKINFPANEKDIFRIADYIRLSKKYISLLNNQLEQYKLQKQGLMQKLLTGEWRIK